MHHQSVRERVRGAVAKSVSRSRRKAAGSLSPCEKPLEGDAAEAHDHAQFANQAHLFVEPRGAVTLFFRGWLVGRRGAADNRGDPQVCKLHRVITGDGFGLGSKARFVQYRIEEVARAIAGERPSGAIGSVRARGQAQDEDASIGIAEGGHRLSPVIPLKISAAADAGYLLAVGAQPRAALAGNDAPVQFVERRGRGSHGEILSHGAGSSSAPAVERKDDWRCIFGWCTPSDKSVAAKHERGRAHVLGGGENLGLAGTNRAQHGKLSEWR